MHLALATMRILEFLTVSFNLPDFGYFGGCHFLQRSMNPVDPSGPIGGDFRTGGRCHGRQPGVLPTRGWGLAEWLENSSWIFLTIMILYDFTRS